MPRFEFWHTETEAIVWNFNRHPLIGEEITLGDAGIFRVTGMRDHNPDPGIDAAYTCDFVRDATNEDIQMQLRRGVNHLPPPA